jgi:hypothetical protein
MDYDGAITIQSFIALAHNLDRISRLHADGATAAAADVRRRGLGRL